ncbi:hypothetical protein [Parvibaculum sp.]|uniref:hypothetical protein n=1 Tax=Parvibaculum sp. TaxID=2024848 RepID=UPI001D5D2999|nr:hypothetical protein [Parvibaculum sp.]MBX3488953.1 hypothetical protein [Parvibaculum sp.]MCW5727178.1 hypothetical protein [Parvibaculum sp.]
MIKSLTATLNKNRPIVDIELKDSTVLWRYLDTAKFLDLTHNRDLFFSRGDKFEDAYEGAFTRKIKEIIDHNYRENGIDFTADEFAKRIREKVFVNCWHRNTNDSMAMWHIYGQSSAAMAITTTVGMLRDSMIEANLPFRWAIKKVRYVNHWRNPEIDIRPYSNIFSYKLKAYEFEKEVRVIVDRSQEFDIDIAENGMKIGVSLEKLLRSIVISPTAPSWFFELISATTEKYGVLTPVRRSKLTFGPK